MRAWAGLRVDGAHGHSRTANRTRPLQVLRAKLQLAALHKFELAVRSASLSDCARPLAAKESPNRGSAAAVRTCALGARLELGAQGARAGSVETGRARRSDVVGAGGRGMALRTAAAAAARQEGLAGAVGGSAAAAIDERGATSTLGAAPENPPSLDVGRCAGVLREVGTERVGLEPRFRKHLGSRATPKDEEPAYPNARSDSPRTRTDCGRERRDGAQKLRRGCKTAPPGALASSGSLRGCGGLTGVGEDGGMRERHADGVVQELRATSADARARLLCGGDVGLGAGSLFGRERTRVGREAGTGGVMVPGHGGIGAALRDEGCNVVEAALGLSGVGLAGGCSGGGCSEPRSHIDPRIRGRPCVRGAVSAMCSGGEYGSEGRTKMQASGCSCQCANRLIGQDRRGVGVRRLQPRPTRSCYGHSEISLVLSSM
ncbi:hypothetical protein B0H15DRAFT_803926 [Mycena belliarum]|uniref:Uncharacterized protein n=1 Tax=Mycena belliarum TaxID=1033014 RepID=A0AAD6TV23_9AGAR|nr:hypothetical protein B0H15DRAFT_803926 [Mycena belliae]